jgi:hypothetical protein
MRVQPRISVSTRTVGQLPPEQVASAVQVRDCVPVVSHVSENPPHVPQSEQLPGVQTAPSVERVHASVSTSALVLHAPASQAPTVHVRLRVPLVAQNEP